MLKSKDAKKNTSWLHEYQIITEIVQKEEKSYEILGSTKFRKDFKEFFGHEMPDIRDIRNRAMEGEITEKEFNQNLSVFVEDFKKHKDKAAEAKQDVANLKMLINQGSDSDGSYSKKLALAEKKIMLINSLTRAVTFLKNEVRDNPGRLRFLAKDEPDFYVAAKDAPQRGRAVARALSPSGRGVGAKVARAFSPNARKKEADIKNLGGDYIRLAEEKGLAKVGIFNDISSRMPQLWNELKTTRLDKLSDGDIYFLVERMVTRDETGDSQKMKNLRATQPERANEYDKLYNGFRYNVFNVMKDRSTLKDRLNASIDLAKLNPGEARSILSPKFDFDSRLVELREDMLLGSDRGFSTVIKGDFAEYQKEGFLDLERDALAAKPKKEEKPGFLKRLKRAFYAKPKGKKRSAANMPVPIFNSSASAEVYGNATSDLGSRDRVLAGMGAGVTMRDGDRTEIVLDGLTTKRHTTKAQGGTRRTLGRSIKDAAKTHAKDGNVFIFGYTKVPENLIDKPAGMNVSEEGKDQLLEDILMKRKQFDWKTVPDAMSEQLKGIYDSIYNSKSELGNANYKIASPLEEGVEVGQESRIIPLPFLPLKISFPETADDGKGMSEFKKLHNQLAIKQGNRNLDEAELIHAMTITKDVIDAKRMGSGYELNYDKDVQRALHNGVEDLDCVASGSDIGPSLVVQYAQNDDGDVEYFRLSSIDIGTIAIDEYSPLFSYAPLYNVGEDGSTAFVPVGGMITVDYVERGVEKIVQLVVDKFHKVVCVSFLGTKKEYEKELYDGNDLDYVSGKLDDHNKEIEAAKSQKLGRERFGVASPSVGGAIPFPGFSSSSKAPAKAFGNYEPVDFEVAPVLPPKLPKAPAKAFGNYEPVDLGLSSSSDSSKASSSSSSKGGLSGLKSRLGLGDKKKKQSEANTEMQISGPTNFRRIDHVGIDNIEGVGAFFGGKVVPSSPKQVRSGGLETDSSGTGSYAQVIKVPGKKPKLLSGEDEEEAPAIPIPRAPERVLVRDSHGVLTSPDGGVYNFQPSDSRISKFAPKLNFEEVRPAIDAEYEDIATRISGAARNRSVSPLKEEGPSSGGGRSSPAGSRKSRGSIYGDIYDDVEMLPPRPVSAQRQVTEGFGKLSVQESFRGAGVDASTNRDSDVYGGFEQSYGKSSRLTSPPRSRIRDEGVQYSEIVFTPPAKPDRGVEVQAPPSIPPRQVVARVDVGENSTPPSFPPRILPRQVVARADVDNSQLGVYANVPPRIPPRQVAAAGFGESGSSVYGNLSDVAGARPKTTVPQRPVVAARPAGRSFQHDDGANETELERTMRLRRERREGKSKDGPGFGGR